MNLDFPRRVTKVRLPITRPLLPIFEAVVNSIQAIDERRVGGRIDVLVHRDRRQVEMKTSGRKPEPRITGFLVQDDGIGFTAENYESFLRADTGHKEKLGGKGVGRFLWLRMFKRVSIDSVYEADDGRRRRTFAFVKTEEGVENPRDEIVEPNTPIATRIDLQDLVEDEALAKTMPKTLNGIASKLLEHCVEYFFRTSCPAIYVRESDGDPSSGDCLNELFKEVYSREREETAITVAGHELKLTHLRMYGADETRHHIRLNANSRPAMEIKLEDVIPAVPRMRLRSEDDNRPFWWSTRISGNYLDNAVDSERGVLDLPAEDDTLDLGIITLPALRRAVEPVLSAALQRFLKPYQDRNLEDARKYIEESAPDLRPLLKHRRREIAALEPGMSPEKLDRDLRRIAFHLREEVRGATATVLANSDQVATISAGLLEKINDLNRGELAAYVAHRKAILEILQRRLELKDDGKYERERAVHELIFPLGKTSADLYADDAHNLWILDERLNYHSYLASDIALSRTPGVTIDSDREPDIVMWDQPVAMSEPVERPSFVVIIEFKRPMRRKFDTAATDNENPLAQVNGYARDLREGKKLDRHGRPLPSLDGVPIYCYIIADLTKELRTLLEDGGNLLPTPGREGYYTFNPNRQTYVEVISYTKVMNDALRRNVAFFDKLGLGSTHRSG